MMRTRLARMGAIVLLAVFAMSRTTLAQGVADRAQLPERLSGDTRAAIRQLMDSMAGEALPARALRDKAAEGVLKGADDARILAAVRALAQRLRRARDVLGRAVEDDALLAASSALYAGVPPEAIARVTAVQRRQRDVVSLGASLTVLSELVTARVPVDVAVSSLDTLLARGAGDEELRAFRTGIDRDIRNGEAPRAAAEAGVRQVLRGLGRTPLL